MAALTSEHQGMTFHRMANILCGFAFVVLAVAVLSDAGVQALLKQASGNAWAGALAMLAVAAYGVASR